MIRFLGIVIATEEEIASMVQTIAKVDKVHLEALKHDLRIAEAKLGGTHYLEADLAIFKSRAEKAEQELAGYRKILEEKRQEELARFKAKEK